MGHLLRENPDKPLVVKCAYHTRNKKVSFESAKNCTYELLRERVERGFALSMQPFSIKWKDDDDEETYITTDNELTEAIKYFYRGGDDDAPTSSSGSILSYRSSSTRRITLHIQIEVDYDGPSLSDSSSLASTDDYQNHNGSVFSFMSHRIPAPPPDDDAATVSSKDFGGQEARRKPDSLFRKLFTGPGRSPGRSNSGSTLRSASSHSEENWDVLSEVQPVHLPIEPSHAAGPLNHTSIATRSPSLGNATHDSTAVLERLKLEDQPSDPSSYTLPTNRSAAWLQDQNRRTIRATLGGLPSPSEEDTFSLGDISLEVDDRGKYYYEYKSSASEASREYGLDDPPITDDNSSLSIQDRAHRDGVTLDYNFLPAESSVQRPSETAVSGRQLPQASGSDLFVHSHDLQPGNFNIPPHLLIPEEVTDCSECGAILDSFRYVCATCGEKKPCSRSELEAVAESVKGKWKAITTPPEDTIMTYPPHAHRSTPSSSSSATVSPFDDIDVEAFRQMRSSSTRKPLPAIPQTSALTDASRPSPNIYGLGHRSNSSTSSSSTRVGGYELCSMCIQKSGNDHSLLAVGSDGSSNSGGESPSSPEDLSAWRRSAPRQKGQMRHAYREKVWGFSGWEDVEQDDSQTSKCSACSSLIYGHRYKCASCVYTLCQACFNDVHNIHPVHAFLMMPDKLMRSNSASDLLDDASIVDAADEPSLKHPGVKCYHCMQDVVGARFRCIDCTNIEVDICANCEAAGLPGNLDSSDGGHISSHVMLKLPTPLKTTEVHSVSRRAQWLRHSRDQADIPGSFSRSSPGSISNYGGTVMGDSLSSAPVQRLDDHLLFCDGCGQSIVGTRYQCASCPSKPASYNLCSSCEEKSYKIHDPFHIFLKLPRFIDNPEPLQSPYPIIPKLYKDPAGSTADNMSSVVNPSAYLKDLLHKSALCDRHMTQIIGKWYRCAYCAKDLCSDCEEIDEHDFTHVFIVFKAPVDMQLFRHFANLDNPNDCRPVLQGPVYFP